MKKLLSILVTVALLANLVVYGCAPKVAKGITKIVSPEQGASLELETISLDIPPGALDKETDIAIGPVERPLPLFPNVSEEEQELLSLICQRVGEVYDVGPHGLRFKNPATLSFRYSDADIPEGFNESDLVAAYLEDGIWYVLEDSTVDTDKNIVSVRIDHFSPESITLLVATSLFLLTCAMLALVAKSAQSPGTVAAKITKYVDRHLKPKEVESFAKDERKFKVDLQNMELKIDGKLKYYDRTCVVPDKNGKQMLDEILKGEAKGNCGDLANLIGSLLIAKGYCTRLVEGKITYPGQERGNHCWVEVLIEGKPYFVNVQADKVTQEITKIELVSLDKANIDFELEKGQMWGKEPNTFKAISEQKYDPNWWTAEEEEEPAETAWEAIVWAEEDCARLIPSGYDCDLFNVIYYSGGTWNVMRCDCYTPVSLGEGALGMCPNKLYIISGIYSFSSDAIAQGYLTEFWKEKQQFSRESYEEYTRGYSEGIFFTETSDRISYVFRRTAQEERCEMGPLLENGIYTKYKGQVIVVLGLGPTELFESVETEAKKLIDEKLAEMARK